MLSSSFEFQKQVIGIYRFNVIQMRLNRVDKYFIDYRCNVSISSVCSKAKNIFVQCLIMKLKNSKKDLFNADIQTVSSESISPICF